jgi:hypothetical protein
VILHLSAYPLFDDISDIRLIPAGLIGPKCAATKVTSPYFTHSMGILRIPEWSYVNVPYVLPYFGDIP